MKTLLISIIFVLGLTLADNPHPAHQNACLALAKDPMQGELECLYCYGYKVVPMTTRCDSVNTDNCIFSTQLGGFPQSFCNLCEKGYSIDLNNQAVCVKVAEADIVENCDYYWIPGKNNQSVCMGCSKGYVANFKDQATS